jgi:hypothetical protein
MTSINATSNGADLLPEGGVSQTNGLDVKPRATDSADFEREAEGTLGGSSPEKLKRPPSFGGGDGEDSLQARKTPAKGASMNGGPSGAGGSLKGAPAFAKTQHPPASKTLMMNKLGIRPLPTQCNAIKGA